MSFLIKASLRLKAAEEKQVRDLSDSSLRRIAEDDEDRRAHQAEQELEKRKDQNDHQQHQQNQLNKSTHNVYETQNLIKRPSDKKKDSIKEKIEKKIRTPILDEEKKAEAGEATREFYRYGFFF